MFDIYKKNVFYKQLIINFDDQDFLFSSKFSRKGSKNIIHFFLILF